eukprot:2827589-Alexandrium_andersonii.AAC.1
MSTLTLRAAFAPVVRRAGGCARGQRAIKRWSTTQKTIALSAGEAELAGVVKGPAEGLGLVAVAHDLGFRASLH